ncbi:MAG: hypothetical protein AB9880_11365 [Christensenellales bacterium]
MKRMLRALPHACIVLSVMFLVFLVLDDYNPMMAFIDSGISKGLLAALCLLSILEAIAGIARERKGG